jgi:SAM-dependent methyltransferase
VKRALSENTTEPGVSCNVCGGREFAPGPAERLSIRGLPPRCLGCGSLERHRVARHVIATIRVPHLFARYRLIRFSADPIVEESWFETSELSIYGGDNSCDLQSIDRPDGSYDVILCSHVLEHVRDDTKAISELARILSKEGFLLVIVPRTGQGKITADWGFPDPQRNFHYRGYGRDFDSKLVAMVPDAFVAAIEVPDPVTGDSKRLHLITKSAFWRDRINSSRNVLDAATNRNGVGAERVS